MGCGALRLALAALAIGQAIAAGPARAGEVTLFAAASTAVLLHAIKTPFHESGGDTIRLSIQASSTLARQIENGAPADVYLSANRAWMDYLDFRGLIEPGTRADLMANRLALIAPSADPVALAVAPGFDLIGALGDGRLAIADPDHVPVGIYGKAALRSLGVWPAVAARTARLANARAVVALVGRGEVPLGIAYATDAALEPSVVQVALLPVDAHPPIVYPIAVVRGRRTAATDRLLAFLTSAEGRGLIRRHGFRVIGGGE